MRIYFFADVFKFLFFFSADKNDHCTEKYYSIFFILPIYLVHPYVMQRTVSIEITKVSYTSFDIF